MRIEISEKIKTLKALNSALKRDRRRGKKIVAISGSMDLLHAGHVWALSFAKEQGNVLVVLLNSDASVKLYKGPYRPIVSEKERTYMVASLACVDYVVLFDDINPTNVLRAIQPHVYCNSSEWGKDCIERAVVESYGGRICVIPRRGGPSTTDILARMKSVHQKKDVCAVFLDRDGTINNDKDGYVYKKEDFEFLPGVISAVKRLTRTEYRLFIVTNQSGIGRGYYTEQDFLKLNRWLMGELKKHGITITKIYHCPHCPEDGCACRKPRYEFLLRAVREYDINLSKSWVVGDTWSDIRMGREANTRTIKIGSRKHGRENVGAHYYVEDLKEAVSLILKS